MTEDIAADASRETLSALVTRESLGKAVVVNGSFANVLRDLLQSSEPLTSERVIVEVQILVGQDLMSAPR
jgi:hypothetical protein